MKKTIISMLLILAMIFSFTGCASSPQNKDDSNGNEEFTIVATSVAICEILDALGYENVIGVPETSSELPDRYSNVETVGSPMNPDLEIIKKLSPDLVLSPKTLEDSLSEQYLNAGISSAFLDLSSVESMYNSIKSLGELLDKEEEAIKIINEYKNYLEDYTSNDVKDNDSLIIMCFPDGYQLIATDKSYVGNLVELAGGNNVYANYNGDENGFVAINPEDMIQKDPDKIFIYAHYNEEEAFANMRKEIETSTTWQHFDAVKEGEVYYLSSEYFGMTANFEWIKALDYLKPIMQGE